MPAPRAAQHCKEAEVFASRQLAVKPALTPEHDSGVAADLSKVPGDVVIEDPRAARCRQEQRCEDLRQRRLASSVAPEQADDCTLIDLEADIAECPHRVVTLTEVTAQPCYLDGWNSHGWTCLSTACACISAGLRSG